MTVHTDVVKLQELAALVLMMENTDFDGTELEAVPEPHHPELVRSWLDSLAEHLDDQCISLHDLWDQMRKAAPRGWSR